MLFKMCQLAWLGSDAAIIVAFVFIGTLVVKLLLFDNPVHVVVNGKVF
jgi:hypothetical protein